MKSSRFAFEFIPSTHRESLPRLGEKCYFVVSDLQWPQHRVEQALLVGYSDVGGLAIVRVLRDGRPSGLRGIYFSRVFRGEKEAKALQEKLEREADSLYKLRSSKDPLFEVGEGRIQYSIAKEARSVGMGPSDKWMEEERNRGKLQWWYANKRGKC